MDKNNQYNSPWRKLATALYAAPRDGRVYGTMEIDITAAQEFIAKSREAGDKLTITHLAVSAIGRIIGFDMPDINAYLKRGKIIPRDDVVVSVAVNMEKGQGMGSIRVHQAHKKTVFQIAREIREKAAESRSGREEKAVENKNSLSRIPWPFRRWTFLLIKFIHHGLGFELPAMGLRHDSFGSVILSNIGSHGLTTGMAALMPAANVPAVIVMGKAEDKPVVRDGQVVIRTMIPFTGTFDHRIMDGYHGGLMAARMRHYMANPEMLASPGQAD